MTISKTQKIKHLTAHLNYLRGDNTADKTQERNLEIFGLNCTVYGAERQFKSVQRAHGKENNISAYSAVISFSKEELDANNPQDVETATNILMDFAREFYGENRQVVGFLQADNKNGILHGHLVGNNTDFITGKAMRGNEKSWYRSKDVLERVMTAYGVENVLNSPNYQNTLKERVTVAEAGITQKGGYSWKEDLRERINRVKDAYSPANDDLEPLFIAEGIDLKRRWSKKHNRDIYSYHFNDLDGKKRSIRDFKLGEEYTNPALEAVFLRNKKILEARLQEEKARQQQKVRERQKVQEPHKNGNLSRGDNKRTSNQSSVTFREALLQGKSPIKEGKPPLNEKDPPQQKREQEKNHLGNHNRLIEEDYEKEERRKRQQEILKGLNYPVSYDDDGYDFEF